MMMREKINWKAFSVGMIVILLGVATILLDIFRWHTDEYDG